MLHTAAVPVNLLDVLKDLQAPLSSSGFALAGGTSLALRIGHRISVDLDFFTPAAFDTATLASQLGIGPESITGQAEGTLQVRINHVKVELLRHAYPRLAADEVIQGIRMWSLEDLAAMKLSAVANRGSKKDFFDLAALLPRFPLQDMIGLYQAKYRPASIMMVVRSLAWFDDADAEPDPISLREDSWQVVKDQISSAIRTLS
jgi:Nucleotidyl transferase AbiEii toxin, Type IV TA system